MSEKEEKLQRYMMEKNAAHKSETLDTNEEDNVLPNRQRSINQEIEGTRQDADAMLLLRRIINFLVMVPLGIIFIVSVGLIVVKLIPFLIFFIRQLIVKVLF